MGRWAEQIFLKTDPQGTMQGNVEGLPLTVLVSWPQEKPVAAHWGSQPTSPALYLLSPLRASLLLVFISGRNLPGKCLWEPLSSWPFPWGQFLRGRSWDLPQDQCSPRGQQARAPAAVATGGLASPAATVLPSIVSSFSHFEGTTT